jgi:Domain of unknown function (DUF4124)
MSRIARVLAALVMAGIGAVAAAETVYKWVDGSGQVHYTDLPPRESGARILGVYQQESGDVEEGDYGDDYSEEGDDDGASPNAPTDAPGTTEPPVSDAAMAAAEADALKAKVEQCKAAQDRYQRYIDSRRLFRETPDGKRVYLTDKELSEARGRAKQSVDDYCS